MKNRIQSIINLEKLSPAEFATLLGIQRSTLSNILGGRNKPSYDILSVILTKLPNLNIEWLMNGKGNPYKDKEKNFRGELIAEEIEKRIVDKKNNLENGDYPSDLFNSESVDLEYHPYPPVENDDILRKLHELEKIKVNGEDYTSKDPFENLINEPEEIILDKNEDLIEPIPEYTTNNQDINSNKSISKIIILYSDNTFEEFKR